MKLFASLLAASTLAAGSIAAPAQASCGNGGGPASNGCNSFSNSAPYNNVDRSITNTPEGGEGGEARIEEGAIDNRNRNRNTNTAEGGEGGEARIEEGAIDNRNRNKNRNINTAEGGEGGEGGEARIEEGAIDNRNRNKNKNTNTAEGGKAVQGQAQGQAQGQRQGIKNSGNSSSRSGAVAGSAARGGDQRQSQSSRSRSGVRNSGNSSNSNSTSSSSTNSNSTSSSSSANNNGNSQTLNYTNIDIPEATVAPLTPNGVPGQVGDVVVPLPSITGGAFITEDDGVFGTNSRNTRGATLGFQIPLGTGQTRRAAEQIIARRERADRFQLIREAAWMLQQGILNEEAHPEHWAALYGTSVETAEAAPKLMSIF